LVAALAFTPQHVILWSVIPGVVAVAVAAAALRQARDGARDEARPGPHERGVAPPRAVVTLVIGFALVRLPETLLLLRLQDLGIPIAVIPVLWALLHAVRTTASYPGGWMSDHVGPMRTMVAGWVLYAVVIAGMAATTSRIACALWFLGFGLVAAATESPERALIAAWGGRRTRGRGFGVYHAGVGIAALPGSLALGALYEWRGGPSALGASAGAVAVLAALGLLVGRGTPRRTASA
jgi:MFS family permease